MNITDKPNLKPFRQYDEQEVINLYAHTDETCNKGTFVTISVAEGNTNVSQNANSPATPHLDSAGSLSNVPSRATVLREAVQWRVATATDGDVVLGVTLYDVKENNVFGDKFMYRPQAERVEQQVVISGEAVPILTRGIIKTNGFSGTAVAGSGGVIAAGLDGQLQVSNANAGRCGKFLTSADADGYAIFKVEL